MRTLARIDSRFGEILIIEDIATGARRFYEGAAFQSHARRDGESCFAYVHIMSELLRKRRRVLLLGCGGGSLATMLCRRGVDVTLVDHNSQSFELARRYFGLPGSVRCIAADYLDYLSFKPLEYEAIGVDVGSSTFNFREEFDHITCAMIRKALSPDGIVAINMMSAHDIDPTADLIATLMASSDRSTWIFDQLGLVERNAVVVAARGGRPLLDPRYFPEELHDELATWSLRASRITKSTTNRTFPVFPRDGNAGPDV